MPRPLAEELRRERGVALVGFDAERLQDDGVEVSRESLAEAVGALPAPSGHLLGLDRAAWIRLCHHRAGRRGRRRAHAPGELVNRRPRCPERAPFGEHLVQQHAEREDVARGRHRPVLELLRTGVVRRQRRGDGLLGRPVSSVDQLGDAEVEKLGLALGVDHDVRRLQVPVDDQALMSALDGRADREHQVDALPDRQPAPRRVGGDRLSFDELHHQEGRAARRGPAVEEPSDPRVVEPGQHLAFVREAAHELAARQAGHHLERPHLADATLDPLRAVDDTHSATADRLQQPPTADLATEAPLALIRVEQRQRTVGQRPLEESALHVIGLADEREGLLEQQRIVGAGLPHPLPALAHRELQRPVEELVEPPPGVAVHRDTEAPPLTGPPRIAPRRRPGGDGARFGQTASHA